MGFCEITITLRIRFLFFLVYILLFYGVSVYICVAFFFSTGPDSGQTKNIVFCWVSGVSGGGGFVFIVARRGMA